METTQIKDALSKLELDNDNHWTSDGAPRMETLEALTGLKLNRADVTATAPAFTRTNPVLDLPPEVEPVATTWAPVVETPIIDDVPEVVAEPEVLDEDDLVMREYNEASVALEAARQRYHLAERAMDVVIQKRERQSSAHSFVDTMQEYQRAMREHREG